MVIFVTRCTQLDAYKNKLFLPKKKRERERERERRRRKLSLSQKEMLTREDHDPLK